MFGCTVNERIVSACRLAAVVISVFACGWAHGGDMWNEQSLSAYTAYLPEVAEIPGRDTYEALDLGSARELGVEYTYIPDSRIEYALALGFSDASGTQRNSEGSGNESNTLQVDLDLTSVFASARLCRRNADAIFVPWIAAGIDFSLIETRESETIAAGGGPITRPAVERSSVGIGVHAEIGVDVYPARASAVAISLRGRYRAAAIDGPFDGDIDGFAVLAAVRWDFGMRH